MNEQTLQAARNYKELNIRMCHDFNNYLNLFSKLEDHYTSVFDVNGNKAIIYSNYGRIFVPACVKIREIEVIETTENCYEHIPVRFRHENGTIAAFLTNDLVLRRTSKIVDCAKHTHIVLLNPWLQAHRIIKKEGKKTTLIKNKKMITKKLNMVNLNISRVNFQHYHKIIEGPDVIKKFMELTSVKEIAGQYFVLDQYNTISKNEALESTVNEISDIWERTKLITLIFIIILVLALIIISMIYVRKQIKMCMACLNCCCNRRGKTKHKNKRNEQNEFIREYKINNIATALLPDDEYKPSAPPHQYSQLTQQLLKGEISNLILFTDSFLTRPL